MDSGLAAVLGALAGGAATVLTTYLQGRVASRHERVTRAADLAAKEHEFDVLLRGEGIKLKESYLAEYVAFHESILRELEKGNGITAATIDQLAEKYGIKAE